MGYRLSIYKLDKNNKPEQNDICCLGGFYGSMTSMNEMFESIKYLEDRGYIEDLSEKGYKIFPFDCRAYGYDVIMPVKEFKEWIVLYNKDCNKYYYDKPFDFMQYDGMEQIFKMNDEDKIALIWGA